ncbi:DUF294 nucleotidyltransferase-like domain-containing protein [Calderihabitans maritimus]|uniref:Nucleotidyltransferase n=1 Tax=Calderihabitans maritimus TaxID=1246530 RepID=A0A1Z5HT02_9FIRM|nr:DUF294 nucleotidyltransferase-like domain-containing protein [Calderihabitans maritimus]GAW92435.1 nucleotidyltransferase [Calderihabitans maritimus]
MNRYVEALQKIQPFDSLPEDTLRQLGNDLELREFEPGSYVFRQGESSHQCLFLIVEGFAEITVIDDRGIETVVGYRKQYDFFGETVVLNDKSYPASVRAVERLKCLILGRDIFETLLDNYGTFSSFFSKILSSRLRELFSEVVHEHSYEAYGLETYPFRKRASEIMSSPVITAKHNDSVKSIAETMSTKNISSVVVVDEEDKPVGLITEKDLVAKIIARERQAAEIAAEEVMSRNMITVTPDTFFYQVLLAMVKGQAKHVAVVDEDTQRLMGIITMRDMVKSRSTGALMIIEEIETQDTIEGLAVAGREIDSILKALIAEKAPVPEIFQVISEFHDRITRKVIAICEKEMMTEGHGSPPVDYCFISMGSAGRKEQTLRTDQDNGIIYRDPDPKQAERTRHYFSLLGNKIVEGLYRCGFAKCRGNVMASNPDWCKSYSAWKRTVANWVINSEEESIRMLSIFLDFRPVAGNPKLAQELQKYVFDLMNSHSLVFRFLAEDDFRSRVPLGLGGRFLVEKSKEHRNEINLKRAASIHVVDCVRLHALRHGITVTSTLERLKALEAKGVFSKDDAQFFAAAYESLMLFTIRENLRKAMKGQSPDSYLDITRLTKREKTMLKDAFKAVTKLQNLTASAFMIM